MFLAGMMGNAGSAPESSGAAAPVSEEEQAVAAGQGISQTVGARPPVEDAPRPTAKTDLPLYQKLGIKTSPGFQMPTVREPVPLEPAAQQMQQKLNLAPRSEFPPPASVYEAEPQSSRAAMRDRFGRPVDDAGIQEMMQDRFSRDEAVNNSQILKKQAAGYPMDTPKGVQSDQFAQSQGKEQGSHAAAGE
jgi:hypothetical protein